MKKILSILLLVIMIVDTIGFYLVYRHNLSSLKHQMKASIKSGTFAAEKLVYLEIDPAKSESLRNCQVVEERELRYYGEMYDIIQVQRVGKKLVFTCIHDKEETRLVTNFINAIHSTGSKQTANGLRLLKYSFSEFTVSAIPGGSTRIFVETNSPNTLFLSPISIRYPEVASPPPWFAAA